MSLVIFEIMIENFKMKSKSTSYTNESFIIFNLQTYLLIIIQNFSSIIRTFKFFLWNCCRFNHFCFKMWGFPTNCSIIRPIVVNQSIYQKQFIVVDLYANWLKQQTSTKHQQLLINKLHHWLIVNKWHLKHIHIMNLGNRPRMRMLISFIKHRQESFPYIALDISISSQNFKHMKIATKKASSNNQWSHD